MRYNVRKLNNLLCTTSYSDQVWYNEVIFPFPNPCNAADVCTFHAHARVRATERRYMRECEREIEGSQPPREFNENGTTTLMSKGVVQEMGIVASRAAHGHLLKINCKITRHTRTDDDARSEDCFLPLIFGLLSSSKTLKSSICGSSTSNDVPENEILPLLPSSLRRTSFPRASLFRK